MATLVELHAKLESARFRKTILNHLLEYLDGSFLPKHGGNPEKVLLTPEKVAVPVESIEATAQELAKQLEVVSAEIEAALAVSYVPSPTQTQPSPPPEVKQ